MVRDGAPASDDTYYTSRTHSDNQVHDIAHYRTNSTNTWIENLWKFKYQTIDRANMTIDGIRNMTGYEENKKLKELEAEARFLRAFIAFDLIKYWGDVPFKTTYSDSYESAYQPRVSREIIYDEIIADLILPKKIQNGQCQFISRKSNARSSTWTINESIPGNVQL